MDEEQTEAAPEVSDAAPQEAAEKDALIAEIEAELDGGASPAKQKAAQPEPEADADGEGEPEADVPDEDEPADVAGAEDASSLRDHVKELVASGDIRKVEEALGLEKGALKVDGAKFRHLRAKAEKAGKLAAEAEQRHAEAQNLVGQAQQTYGGMVRAKQEFATGTAQGIQRAARFVEGHFGVPLAQFVDAVVKAGRGEAQPQRGPDPEVAELKAQLQKMQEERSREKAAETERAAAERHVATIKGKLAGNPIAVLPDAAKLVYERLRGSYDRDIDGYTLTLKDAIAAVQADPATKWRLHELKQKAAAKAAPAPAPKPVPGRRQVVTTQRMTPAEAEAAEKAALIAELEAEERKKERAQRYGKRT